MVMLIKTFLGLFSTVPSDVTPPPYLVSIVPDITPLPHLLLLIFPGTSLLFTYRVEFLISINKISWEKALPCHIANITTILTLPVVFLSRQESLDGVTKNLIICLSYIILAMKLVSFIQVNKRNRDEMINSNNNSEEIDYPSDLTLANLVYFWMSPTLIYQPNVSHLSGIRLKVVLLRLMELCIMQVMVRQFMVAIPYFVIQLLDAAEKEDLLLVIERFFTLSLAFNIVWMTSFYILFVSFLQLSSEILQVKERKFFHSWWNASTMEEFWRWWNLPVHRWCVKHIYLPFVKHGFSKMTAMMVVFLTSALLHEYLISCPLQITGHFALIGFLAQMPLCKLSQFVTTRCGEKVGNFLVWGVLVFGNTLGVVVYAVVIVRII